MIDADKDSPLFPTPYSTKEQNDKLSKPRMLKTSFSGFFVCGMMCRIGYD